MDLVKSSIAEMVSTGESNETLPVKKENRQFPNAKGSTLFSVSCRV